MLPQHFLCARPRQPRIHQHSPGHFILTLSLRVRCYHQAVDGGPRYLVEPQKIKGDTGLLAPPRDANHLHRKVSQATENILRKYCSYRYASSWTAVHIVTDSIWLPCKQMATGTLTEKRLPSQACPTEQSPCQSSGMFLPALLDLLCPCSELDKPSSAPPGESAWSSHVAQVKTLKWAQGHAVSQSGSS